jgi:hypothetical protein
MAKTKTTFRWSLGRETQRSVRRRFDNGREVHMDDGGDGSGEGSNASGEEVGRHEEASDERNGRGVGRDTDGDGGYDGVGDVGMNGGQGDESSVGGEAVDGEEVLVEPGGDDGEDESNEGSLAAEDERVVADEESRGWRVVAVEGGVEVIEIDDDSVGNEEEIVEEESGRVGLLGGENRGRDERGGPVIEDTTDEQGDDRGNSDDNGGGVDVAREVSIAGVGEVAVDEDERQGEVAEEEVVYSDNELREQEEELFESVERTRRERHEARRGTEVVQASETREESV